jgi:hypothetical protein
VADPFAGRGLRLARRQLELRNRTVGHGIRRVGETSAPCTRRRCHTLFLRSNLLVEPRLCCDCRYPWLFLNRSRAAGACT